MDVVKNAFSKFPSALRKTLIYSFCVLEGGNYFEPRSALYKMEKQRKGEKKSLSHNTL